jgi:hypothetical protein
MSAKRPLSVIASETTSLTGKPLDIKCFFFTPLVHNISAPINI